MDRLLHIPELQKAVFAATLLGLTDTCCGFGHAIGKQQHETMAVIRMLIFRCWWTWQMLAAEQQFKNDCDTKTFLQVCLAKTILWAPWKSFLVLIL